MSDPLPYDHRLKRLQGWRNRPERDNSMAFLESWFKRTIEKPADRLGGLAEVWAELVPPELARHTRLESLSRGILKVCVASSSELYELDTLLRSGLESQLITSFKGGSLRKVRLRVGAMK